MAPEQRTQSRPTQIGTVFLNERRQRFEFLVRGADGTQAFGHYRAEDAERHREQYAGRLRERGHVVVMLDCSDPSAATTYRRRHATAPARRHTASYAALA
jgi:hypothetical protein